MSNFTNFNYLEKLFNKFNHSITIKDIIENYYSELKFLNLFVINAYIINKEDFYFIDCNLLKSYDINNTKIFEQLITDNKVSFLDNLSYFDIKKCILLNLSNNYLVILEIENYKENFNLENIFKITEVFLLFFINRYLSEKINTLKEDKISILNDIYKKMIQSNDVDELLYYIASFLTIRKSFDRVLILIQDKDELTKYSGIVSNIENKQKISIVFESELDIKSNLSELLKNSSSISKIANEKTFISVPIISKNKIIGILGVDNYFKQKNLNKNEINILYEISEQIGYCIDNLRLYEDIKLNTISFKQLFEVSSSFNSILDYEEAAKIIINKIASAIFVSNAYLISFETEKHCKIIASLKNKFLNNEIKLTEPIRQALITNKIVSYNYKKNPDVKCLDLKYALISPLRIKNKIIAILCLGEDNQDEERIFSQHDISLLETMSEQASITLENARLYNRLEDIVLERTVELIESNKELQSQKEKLEILSNRLEAILDSIPDGIVVIDENNKILSYNKSFEDIINNIFINKVGNLLGISIDTELVCKNNITDFNMKSLLKLIENIKNELKDNYKNPIDFQISNKENQILYYKVLMAPVKFISESKNLNTVIVFNNITKEKEIDKLKSDFIAVVSHELKTPVSAMIGFSTLLEDGIAGKLNEAQIDYLQKIQSQGQRLIRLINDLLDFSKLEAGQMQIYYDLVDLNEIALEIIETLRPLVDEKNMTIIYNIQNDIPPIKVDSDKLKQILINLIGNAIKFTPENIGRIELNISKFSDNKILFYVKDNGIGIPKKNISKLFDRFYQVDNSSTRKYGGTGLGLAIVKKLVEIHKGRIWVESEVGKGSTFFFVLPISPDTN
ncbi:MAG: hypothetical protein KatS3mg068_0261 [Candidatus Sericytochromatia bacterium]|nr:MAG: hypothetical protein KatS3mg068_0261 [Candidatus Sericytochromatia bacterium]